MPDDERVETQEEETVVEEAEEVAIEEQTPEPDAEIVEQEPAEVETVEEETPVPLSESEASALLAESNLPDVSRALLGQKDWPDEGTLAEAIEAEVAYVTELTGSGRPVGQEAPIAPVEERSNEELLRERYAEIEKRHGVYRGNEED